MKTLLKIVLFLSGFIVPSVYGAAVTPISTVPATNKVNQPDLVVIDSTNGGGAYTTRVITASNFTRQLTTNIAVLLNQNVFNVTNYGAVGDGVTDSTFAISNAWNAWTNAGQGVLYFPAGTYLDSGKHTINDLYQSSLLVSNMQFSKLAIKGDSKGTSFWKGMVTNANWISVTNAGLLVKDISFANGGSGTNTGIAQYGGNGNGQSIYENVAFFKWPTGIYANMFSGRIYGDFCQCGNGLFLGVQTDEIDVAAGGWGCTNAVVVMGQGSAAKLRVWGTFNKYCVIANGGTVFDLSGGAESYTNAFLRIGYDSTLAAYPFGGGGAYVHLHDLYVQSIGTNPMVIISTNAQVTVGANTFYNGSGNAIQSSNAVGDSAKIQLEHINGINIGLSGGGTVNLLNGYASLFNEGWQAYNGASQVAKVDTSGNGQFTGALTVGGQSFFTNGASFTGAGGWGQYNIGMPWDGVNPGLRYNVPFSTVAMDNPANGLVVNVGGTAAMKLLNGVSVLPLQPASVSDLTQFLTPTNADTRYFPTVATLNLNGSSTVYSNSFGFPVHAASCYFLCNTNDAATGFVVGDKIPVGQFVESTVPLSQSFNGSVVFVQAPGALVGNEASFNTIKRNGSGTATPTAWSHFTLVLSAY